MITVIGSLKGGSGKSTVTFNLGVWLSMAGRSVQLIDLDPQATLSDVVDVRQEDGHEPRLSVVAGKDVGKLIDAEADHVLIDIGTANLDGMKQAIKLAEQIVVPVPPSQADIWSTQRFLKFVSGLNGDRKPPTRAFINRADTHRAIRESDEAAAALVSLPDVEFVKPRLAQRTVFRRSFSEGLAVFELEPRGKGAQEWNALCAVLFNDVLS